MSTPAPFPKRFRAKYSKSKNGCLSCRARRKRCGLEKPICHACKRRSSSCCWPDDVSGVADVPALEVTTNISLSKLSREKAGTSAFNTKNDGSEATLDFSESPTPRLPLWHPPQNVITCQGRAAGLTAISGHLLQHYIERTLSILTTRSPKFNAFKILLPVAATDDLLMHSVLALSGTHFNADAGVTMESRQVTSKHYILALKGIRQAVELVTKESRRRWLRLGMTLILIAHVESISGNTSGAIFPHLRGLREIIVKLRASEGNELDTAEQYMEGLIYETYAYLAIVSNIVPSGAMQERQLPLDPFLTNLEYLRDYPSYGTFIGCSRAMFELILPVSTIARSIMLDLQSSPTITDETAAQYYSLVDYITNLQLPGNDDVIDTQFYGAQLATCELYRHALLMWLKSAFLNFIPREGGAHPEIQLHLDAAHAHIIQAMMSPYATILLWPGVILGSCIVRLEDIESTRHFIAFSTTRLRLDVIEATTRLLNTVWDTPVRLCGPAGLLQVMLEHGINLCMG